MCRFENHAPYQLDLSQVGGHAFTYAYQDADGQQAAIDMGFIFGHHRSYLNLLQVLKPPHTSHVWRETYSPVFSSNGYYGSQSCRHMQHGGMLCILYEHVLLSLVDGRGRHRDRRHRAESNVRHRRSLFCVHAYSC